MHNLEKRYQVFDECRTFWNESVDFLNPNVDSQAVIACMHQLTLLLVQNMDKYYTKKQIGVIILHCLKHCVRRSGSLTHCVLSWRCNHADVQRVFASDAGCITRCVSFAG